MGRWWLLLVLPRITRIIMHDNSYTTAILHHIEQNGRSVKEGVYVPVRWFTLEVSWADQLDACKWGCKISYSCCKNSIPWIPLCKSMIVEMWSSIIYMRIRMKNIASESLSFKLMWLSLMYIWMRIMNNLSLCLTFQAHYYCLFIFPDVLSCEFIPCYSVRLSNSCVISSY